MSACSRGAPLRSARSIPRLRSIEIGTWPARARSTHRSPVPLARSSTRLPARQAELADGPPPPAHVEAERHDPVDQVVARRDGVEHLAHRGPLLVALGQRVAIPARRRRHRRRGYGAVGRRSGSRPVDGDDVGIPGAVESDVSDAVLDVRRQPVADLGRQVGELQRGRVDVPRPRLVDARRSSRTIWPLGMRPAPRRRAGGGRGRPARAWPGRCLYVSSTTSNDGDRRLGPGVGLLVGARRTADDQHRRRDDHQATHPSHRTRVKRSRGQRTAPNASAEPAPEPTATLPPCRVTTRLTTWCSGRSCRRAGRWSWPRSTGRRRSGTGRSRSPSGPRSWATTRSGSTTTSTTCPARPTRRCSSAGRRSPRSASARAGSASARWSAATATATPALLAKITSTVDVISGGRLDWGIGAGWYENEYRGYGYEFPQPKDRIGMLRETVEIVKSMWTQPETTFRRRRTTTCPGPTATRSRCRTRTRRCGSAVVVSS